MPFNQLNNSAVLRNKENARQIDPQNSLSSSPLKPTTINQSKSSPLKKNLTTQINQLKIKLSDRDFELKRLEEDCSVKLALMYKELAKEKNDKKQILKESKEKQEEDKHYYETKLTMLEQQWKAKVEKLKNQAVNEAKVIQNNQKQSLKMQYQQQIKELKAQIECKQQQFLRGKQQRILAHEKELNSVQLRHKSLLQELIANNEAEINQLKVNHLSELQFYQQIEEQRSKEQIVVSKILSDKIRALQQEIRSLRLEVSSLNKEIQLKNEQMMKLKKEKQDIRLDKICLQRKLGRLQPELRQTCEKDIKKVKTQYEQLLAEQVAQFTQKITSLTTLYEQSTSSYQAQILQLEERSKQVVLLHSTMKSNEDDIKKIEMLEMKLIKREMELEKQRQDTKMCRLELGNMDQMFQKMFQDAKVKSLKTRKHKLPSLISVGQHRTTMDCYSGPNSGNHQKENKKFSIREVNYNSISKAKESEFSVYE